jgi:hypothetical protein
MLKFIAEIKTSPMKISTLTLLTLLFVSPITAQTNTSWVLGLGINIVDDDGKPLKDLMNLTNGWNALPMPSTFKCEKFFNHRISVEFTESINSYQIGKVIDTNTITANRFFLSTDLDAKFHVNSLYEKIEWFDPVVIGGFGITLRGKSVVPTGNFGFGATFWVSSRIGIHVQSLAKFSLSKAGSNYLQHCLGVSYKFS